MKTRKILALLLCVIMIAGLAACGQTSQSQGTPTPAETQTQNGSSNSDGRVHITYAQWGNDTETAACQAVADKFNTSQDEITVEVLKIDHDSYITKLNSMATAGELPDTAIMSEAGVITFAVNGMLADISGMYGEGDSKPLDCITFKYKGAPVAYSAANEVLGLWYNTDLLQQICSDQGYDINEFTPPAGADDAWDWDTFVEKSCKLTIDVNGNNALSPDFDPDNVDIYGCCVNANPWQMEVWALSNGGGYFSSDATECTIDSAATTEAIQKVSDLTNVYHCAPTVSSASNALSTSLGTGKIVMCTDGAWNVGTFLGPSATFDYGVGVLPYMKNKVTLCTGGPNVVFASAEHPEEAMTWLKWYYQEENSWSLIEAGTWMPILEKWYTDSDLISKWIDNPNFPDHDMYQSAVVDYAMNNAVSAAWYYVNGTDVFNTTLDTALSYIWTGDMTAQEAIDQYYPELNDIFTENNS